MKKDKSEIRSSKFETNSKFKGSKFKTFRTFEFWKFGFVSDSGFRHSSLAVLVAAVMTLLTGCPAPLKIEEPLCAGKATTKEAVAVLRQKQAQQLSLRAAVHCDIEIANPQGKPNRENFDGKMVFAGPDNLRIGGDKFGPIQIGANAEEFWFYVKPVQDTARWGRKKDIPLCVEKLGFNPSYLAEALGQIDLRQDWVLVQQPGFDILVGPGSGGVKKIYINCCSYEVERIEYADIMGRLIASVDLSDRVDVPQVGRVPRMIEMRHFRSAQTDLILRLRLSGISFFAQPQTQTKLFDRPQPKGYGSVYRWTENCEFVAD
jgi:hypothetical protein